MQSARRNGGFCISAAKSCDKAYDPIRINMLPFRRRCTQMIAPVRAITSCLQHDCVGMSGRIQRE